MRHSDICMVLFMTLFFAANGSAQATDTLFFDNFDGLGTTDLNGTTPDTTTGGKKWVATYDDFAGNTTTSNFAANGAVTGTGSGSATLAFTPTNGLVYTLDASITVTNTDANWLAFGFASGQSSVDSNNRFLTGNAAEGSAWMIVRGSTDANQTFYGAGNVNGVAWPGLNNGAGSYDLRIVLDTTGGYGNWTGTWYAKTSGAGSYTELRSATPLGAAVSISSVGFAKSNGTGSLDSFSLTRPTPPPNPLAEYIHKSTVGLGYATAPSNATSFSRDNLVTVGDQQFATYYEPEADGGNVIVARRTIGSDTWTLSTTSFTSNNISNAHNIIAMAVDGDGVMHLSWGMHNDQYHYAKSTGPVTTPGQIITFGPDLGTMTNNESSVTYPEFVNLPNGDLLFLYRDGVSGNGDLRLNRYDNQTHSWSAIQLPLIDGTAAGDPSSSSPYWNTSIVDSAGRMHLSWVNRWNANAVNSFEGFQTNHDIMYAVSDDQGATWKKADGTPYGLPITQTTSDVGVSIAQGSSLINTTSMAVDAHDRPVIATWWAPQAGAGNHVRQYMLAWFDGTDWQTSQITDFDTDYDGGNSAIPESQLGSYRMTRPVVLVTKDDRVLVLFADYRLGNRLMMVHSQDRTTWEFLELDDTVLGQSELAIDTVRWERDGIISMIYLPTGLGSAAETLSVFEFDANAYFAAVPEPGSMSLMGLGGLMTIKRRRG